MGFVADTAPVAASAPRGFVPDPAVGEGDPDMSQPNMARGNKVFARTLGDAFSSWEGAQSALSQVGEGAAKTLTDVGQIYPAVEAGLNAGTGLLFGFPASIGASLSGLYSKHVLGMDVDPKELADTISRIATYQPVTERGQRLTGNLMMPLQKLAEGAQGAGEAVTRGLVKIGAPDAMAAGAGAITDAAIQMLPFPLLGELHRKMAGQTVTAEDMKNVAKVLAGPDAPAATVGAVEKSLRSSYDKTGIGPYTILDAAGKDAGLKADLVDPAVDVPKALEAFVPKPEEGASPRWLADLAEQRQADAGKYSVMTADELDAAHEQAVEHNKQTEIDAARQFLGSEKADELAAITTVRKRNAWLDANVTDEMQDHLNKVQLPEETIKEYRDAANAFDTESPEGLGRSIAVISRHVDEPGFMQSPDGATFRNALRYAKEQGWSLDDVLNGMRGRAAEWAGDSAKELFSRLFQQAGEKSPGVPAGSAIKRLPAPAADRYSHLYGDMEPKFDVPEQSQATLRTVDGQPELIIPQVLLTDATPTIRTEHIAEPGEQMVRFAIRSPEGDVQGHVELLLQDGKVAGLNDIHVQPALRQQGVAAKVVEAITSLEPDRKLAISNIVPGAESFWEKVGAPAYDGNKSPTLDWHQYAESPTGRNAGATLRSSELGGKPAEADAGSVGGGGSAPPVGDATELSADDAQRLAQDPTYRPGAGTLNAGLNPEAVVSAVRGIVKGTKDVANGIIDSKAGQEITGALFPMSTGSVKAQATAQRFANAMRLARFQWTRMGEFIRDNFTPEERQAMWDAADEENLIRGGKLEAAPKRGLEQLTPKQRDAVEHLHELSQGLWKRAQDAGVVEGEGLPFWTPRMAVRIGEDGDFLRPGGEGKAATSKGEGGNVKTSAPSTKQRKHTLADETEAAMKAKLGDDTEMVRDIGVMPVAMSRMAQAIAGRELVNQLKEYGQAIGKDVVSDSGGPGFTTIDHPAFTTYRPDFITDADGKTVPRVDQNGDTVMNRTPMHISDEWAGPLKAVLSTTDGIVYRAYMLMKSKAMTAIMISPAAHNMVIWGRAMAYDPAAVGTLKAYFSGHALTRDTALMSQAISDGMVPIGANRGSMMDITDVARGIGKEGGWGDSNESWINLATQKAVNVFSEKAGTNVKAAMDAFGDFWHHTLLWKQVGALQTYIYNDYRNLLLEKGHPPEVAGPIAAHLANRYAGAVAAENSSEMLRKALNVMLFSRSFNVGNIGAVHDTAFGLPAGLRAKMLSDVGEEAAGKGLDAARTKARLGLAADVGVSMLLTAVTSAAVAKLLLHQTADDIKEGYVRRLSDMLGNIQEHPLNPTSYNPYRILPTYENEEGKKDRIDLGAQPGGRHEYVRLPTGKVVEDTVGWLIHAPETLGNKLSPMVKAAWQAVTNNKGFDVPVEDPSGNTLKHIAQGMEHVIQAQVPMDQLKTLADVAQGHGTEIDKAKLIGAATGFTVSQGNPHGPEAGAFFAQQDRIKAEKAYAMEEVKSDIKKGDDNAAFERLKAVGLGPREIVMTINNIKNPRPGMSRPQAKKFIAQSNDEDRAAMENARRPAVATE